MCDLCVPVLYIDPTPLVHGYFVAMRVCQAYSSLQSLNVLDEVEQASSPIAALISLHSL